MNTPKGVAFNGPPRELVPSIRSSIATAFEQLPDGARGGVFTVVTEAGANAAIATRMGEHVTVVGYVGKTWGTKLTGGAAAQIIW